MYPDIKLHKGKKCQKKKKGKKKRKKELDITSYAINTKPYPLPCKPKQSASLDNTPGLRTRRPQVVGILPVFSDLLADDDADQSAMQISV